MAIIRRSTVWKRSSPGNGRGFTRVELLIVVIILAILAAIVIPQFSSATTDANEAALDSNLSALRSATELYKAQHNNTNPGATITSGGAGCATGAKGTGAVNSAQSLLDQLSAASDATGLTCTVADNTYRYGPYLKTGMPSEPILKKGALAAEIAVTSTGVPIVPAAATGGWAYDTKSGQIVMNSNAADSKAVLYYKH
jgi:prepilin-type N-terminal cleavage/methylation domain-containing protein